MQVHGRCAIFQEKFTKAHDVGVNFLKSYDSEIKLASLAELSAKTLPKWNCIIISKIGKKIHKVVSFDKVLSFMLKWTI